MSVIHTCISPKENDGRSLRCQCRKLNGTIHADDVASLVEQGVMAWVKVSCNGKLKEIRSEAILAIDREHHVARTVSAKDILKAYTDHLGEGNFHQKRIEIFDELTQGIFVDLGAMARRRRS